MNLDNSSAIEQYCINKSSLPSPLATELEQATRKRYDMAQMLVGKLEASFLTFLIQLSKAKRVLEFGTFTGYSALVFAEALPKEGEVHTLDINPATVEFGKSYWEKSEHKDKIHFHLGEALENIKKIEGNFDFIFIDADKRNYLNYLKISLERLNPNGVIALDNTLWSGKVLNDETNSISTQIIRETNDFIAAMPDIQACLLPIRDGLFLVRKNL